MLKILVLLEGSKEYHRATQKKEHDNNENGVVGAMS